VILLIFRAIISSYSLEVEIIHQEGKKLKNDESEGKFENIFKI
jgi:hypothetical protein